MAHRYISSNKRRMTGGGLQNTSGINAVAKIICSCSQYNPQYPYFQNNDTYATSGSCFMINAEQGLFVTNAHVVNQANEISIIMRSLNVIPIAAKVLGVLFEKDIAIVQINYNSIQDKQFVNATELCINHVLNIIFTSFD